MGLLGVAPGGGSYPRLFQPGGPAAGVGALPAPVEAPHGGRRAKLSAILDQAWEAELIPLSPPQLQLMFLNYHRTCGGLPPPDHEPTADQLSALAQVIAADSPPYADFAIFGPHGNRMARRMAFTSFRFDPATGEYIRQELYGPPDYPTWWKSWVVLRTALMLLNEVRFQPLEMYGDFINSLVMTYGSSCWWLIYAADVRMRSEQHDRLRRSFRLAAHERLQAPVAHIPFDPRHPWDAVFGASVSPTCLEAQAFWRDEVHTKALLFLLRHAPQPGPVHGPPRADDPDTVPGLRPGGPAAPRQGAPERRGNRNPRRAAAPRREPPGEVCLNWNAGFCQARCPANRRHVCQHCGGHHRGVDCRPAPRGAPRGGGGGKGGHGRGHGRGQARGRGPGARPAGHGGRGGGCAERPADPAQ